MKKITRKTKSLMVTVQQIHAVDLKIISDFLKRPFKNKHIIKKESVSNILSKTDKDLIDLIDGLSSTITPNLFLKLGELYTQYRFLTPRMPKTSRQAEISIIKSENYHRIGFFKVDLIKIKRSPTRRSAPIINVGLFHILKIIYQHQSDPNMSKQAEKMTSSARIVKSTNFKERIRL